MAKLEQAVVGGGCFWCLEAAYELISGVKSVVPGYTGGHTDNPTYEQVVGGRTGHAEVVQIQFDPAVITFPEILDVFWVIHDPTTPNRQGYDVGPEYRSLIAWQTKDQLSQAESSIAKVQKLWPNPVVTELFELERFWPAEEYHRNFFKKHPESAYCQVIINPKLVKLRQKFSDRIKP